MENNKEMYIFKELLNSIKLNNEFGKTVLYTYGDQELLKDSNGKYYLSNTIYSGHEKELSKIAALELEKEFRLKQNLENKNRFFED